MRVRLILKGMKKIISISFVFVCFFHVNRCQQISTFYEQVFPKYVVSIKQWFFCEDKYLVELLEDIKQCSLYRPMPHL